jgi:hypothetical protein
MPTKNIETREIMAIRASNAALMVIIYQYENKADGEYLLLNDWHHKHQDLQGRVKALEASVAVVVDDVKGVYERREEALWLEPSEKATDEYKVAVNKWWAVGAIDNAVTTAAAAISLHAGPTPIPETIQARMMEIDDTLTPDDPVLQNELLVELFLLWQQKEEYRIKLENTTAAQQWIQVNALKEAQQRIEKNLQIHYDLKQINETLKTLVADLEAFIYW